jgi:hypothetical protein
MEAPGIQKLLVKRGGHIAVDVIASILDRPQPTQAEITQACANLYIDLWVNSL